MRVKTLLLLGVPLVGLGAFAWLSQSGAAPESLAVSTAPVRRGEIIRKVRAVGHVQPAEQIRLSSNLPGQLVALHVREGAQVKRGQVLAEIDSEVVRALVQQREAQHRTSKSDIEAAQARLALARREHARVEGLQRGGHVSAEEVARAASEVEVLEAALEAARQRSAQSLAELAEARSQLVFTRLAAPLEGTVLSVKKRVGERVLGPEFTEDVILVLAPLQAMLVDVSFSELDVVHLAVGQPAQVRIRALGDARVPGELVSIALEAEIRDKGQASEVTLYGARVALERVPEGLRPGMSAAVTVTTATRQGVLSVPIEAVTTRAAPPEAAPAPRKDEETPTGPAYLVYTEDAGKVRARPVRVGATGDTHVEVLEGLSEGERVVVGPYEAVTKQLADGTPVRVTGAVATADDSVK